METSDFTTELTGSVMLNQLYTQIDNVLLLIAAALLLIEIAETLFKGEHKGKTFWEMGVSLSTQIPFIVVEVLILTGAYAVFFIVAEFVPWSIPHSLWGILLAIFVADFFYYWEHRIAHEVRILWTQHAVHHSSRDYNIITAVRFGPFEGVWALIIHIPMVLMGFSAEMVIFSSLVVLSYQTWLHTEKVGKLGPLEWVLNTPSHHRVHHGSDDKYLDKNYGGISIIWDRLFGSFQVEEERPRYGLKGEFETQNPLRVWAGDLPGMFKDIREAEDAEDVRRAVFGPPGQGSKPLPPRRSPQDAQDA